MKKRNTAAQTKPTETVKSTEKSSTPETAASVSIENYFEIDGEQIKVEDIVAKICAENDGFQTLQTYFNFAERRCYYVADGKAEDKFVEF